MEKGKPELLTNVAPKKHGENDSKAPFEQLLNTLLKGNEGEGDLELSSNLSSLLLSEGEQIEDLSLEALVTELLKEEEMFLADELLTNEEFVYLLSFYSDEVSEKVHSLIQEEAPMTMLLDEELPDELLLAIYSAQQHNVHTDREMRSESEQEKLKAIFHSLLPKENKGKPPGQLLQWRDVLTAVRQGIDRGQPDSIFGGMKLQQAEKIVKAAFSRHMTESLVQNQPSASIQPGGDFTTLPMSKVQQHVVHLGESRSSEQQLQQFIRQFESILSNRSFQQVGQGVQQLSIKLHPEHLGRLDITLTQTNGVMVARMMASNTFSREIIESQLHQLRHAFQGQQIQVDRIEVTQQQSQQPGLKDKNEEPEQHSHQQENAKDDDEGQPEEEESFAGVLEQSINTKV